MGYNGRMNAPLWLALEHKRIALGESDRVFLLRTGKTVDLDPTEADVLGALATACTLERLSERLVGQGWEKPATSDLQEVLNALQVLGLVVQPAEALAVLVPTSGGKDRSPGLAALSWLTCDRPAQLQETLEAWAAQVKASGMEPPEFVISNDSRQDERATQQVVEKFALSYPGRTRHLDREWRRQLVERFPTRLQSSVKFALGLSDFGVAELPSYGAASNALLLALAGRQFTLGDDDVLPQFRTRRDAHSGLAFQSQLDSARILPLAGPSDAVAISLASSRAPFGPHARYLGRAVPSLLAEEGFDVEGLSSRDLAGASLPHARVAAVMFHYWGDSGLSDHRFLLQHRELVDPTTYLPQEYPKLRQTRQVFRAPLVDTLGGHTVLGGHLAIDGTQLVPPFAPYGRNQDGLWSGLLRFLQPESFVLNPREAILHAPRSERSLTEPGHIEVLPRINDVLLALLAQLSASESNLGVSYALAGAYLEHWGNRSPGIVQASVGELHARTTLALHTRLEEQLETYGAKPKPWAEDVHRALEHLERQLRSALPYSPQEFPSSTQAIGTYVSNFGKLLAVWPEVWQVAEAKGVWYPA